MPIKGLTEQRRLPRLGKIHLGVKAKTKTGVMYPQATDYFVCPPEVQTVYGEKPYKLDIIIPVEDEEMWASQYYRRYSQTRGLVCKGDGITCRRMLDTETGDTANRDTKAVKWAEGMTCEGRDCLDYKRKSCQEVMNLQFLLPKVPGLGIWQIDTGSINSIRNINNCAAMIRAVCERVRWIPLTLTLEPTEVINPDDGKKKIVRCLNLRHEQGLHELLLTSGKTKTELLITAPAEDEQPGDIEVTVVGGKIIDHGESPDVDDVDSSKLPSTTKVPATAEVKPKPRIDMAQLMKNLNTLHWPGVFFWLRDTFHVTGYNISDIVKLLTPEQQGEFLAEVKSRLELQEK